MADDKPKYEIQSLEPVATLTCSCGFTGHVNKKECPNCGTTIVKTPPAAAAAVAATPAPSDTNNAGGTN